MSTPRFSALRSDPNETLLFFIQPTLGKDGHVFSSRIQVLPHENPRPRAAEHVALSFLLDWTSFGRSSCVFFCRYKLLDEMNTYIDISLVKKTKPQLNGGSSASIPVGQVAFICPSIFMFLGLDGSIEKRWRECTDGHLEGFFFFFFFFAQMMAPAIDITGFSV